VGTLSMGTLMLRIAELLSEPAEKLTAEDQRRLKDGLAFVCDIQATVAFLLEGKIPEGMDSEKIDVAQTTTGVAVATFDDHASFDLSKFAEMLTRVEEALETAVTANFDLTAIKPEDHSFVLNFFHILGTAMVGDGIVMAMSSPDDDD